MGEVAGAVLGLIALEIPPGPGLGVRGLVGPQGLDLPGRQGPVVDPRVVDRSGQHLSVARPHVPQAEDGDVALRAQQVDVLGLVGGVRLAVAVDADLMALVDDGHLHEDARGGGFGGA